MHQYLALLARLRAIIAHPSIYRQGEEPSIDVHLQWLDQIILLLVAIAGVHVQVIIAFLFTCDVGFGADGLRDVIDVTRGHKTVTQAGIKCDLLRLDFKVGTVGEAQALERNGPTFRLLNEVVPYDV